MYATKVPLIPGIDSTEITTKRLLLLKLPKPVTPDAELLLLIFFD